MEESRSESDEDDDTASESSMPDAPAPRSPSPVKRFLSKETIGPSTDQMDDDLPSSPEVPVLPRIESEEEDGGPPSEPPGDESDEEYVDEAERKEDVEKSYFYTLKF